MQTNPNCGKMWKDAAGYHMCMLPVDHDGPCECPHGPVTAGMPAFKNNPGAGSGKQGHEQIGTWGDKSNPIQVKKTAKK